MRLLRVQNDGEFSLVEYLGNDIPDYAILSHTWGSDHDEVTYHDIVRREGTEKAGYHKIRFCAEEAMKDALCYFWVDTCCIDKTSSAELSEAINSMFRFYQNAKKCYVYLSDVSSGSALVNEELVRGWKPAFRRSRWFTRGWTLQELIAPKSVVFYSAKGERLGDRDSLKQTLHEITGIAIDALTGSSLSRISVEERFSWASQRQTKREEDAAYCLLGIFDIHMSLIYGEGRQKSFKRLRKEIQEASEDTDTAPIDDSTGLSQNQNEKITEIQQWLAAPDPSTNHHKASKQQQANTGLWFLESEEYTEWKVEPTSPLWLYGIAGCGKTILSSTILENVFKHCHNHPLKVTLYFYFDFNDKQKQDPELMLRSLVSQIVQQSKKTSSSIKTLYSSCMNRKCLPSRDALLDILKKMIQEFLQVFIVIDALDECAERTNLMGSLETIAGWRLRNLHLLFTSRREWDIERSLEDVVDYRNTISLQSEVVDADIQRYIRQRLSDDKSLHKWSKDITIRQEIETALMKKARGMFRWAVCQLDALGNCRSRAALRKSLASLPLTLDQTYERILANISEHDSEYAIRILRWLTFSARPLSLEEIAEIIALDIEHDTFDADEVLEDPWEVLNICSSLITVVAVEDNHARYSPRYCATLAHYSVKEYLLSDRIGRGNATRYHMHNTICHEAIARGCLVYLSQFQQPELDGDKLLDVYKLAEYSASYWVTHAQLCGHRIRRSMHDIMIRLFSTENLAYLNWIRLSDPDYRWRPARHNFRLSPESIPHPLYMAARSGFMEVVSDLLGKGADPNSVLGGRYGSPLAAAASKNYTDVAELLLDHGANPNDQQRGDCGSPLNAASMQGHEEMVKQLLDKGADPNMCDDDRGTPLETAVIEGHEHVVRLLLKNGADPNIHGEDKNPLFTAIKEDNEQIVKLLLDNGANPNAQVMYYHNPVYTASEEGFEQMVMLLLDRGAHPNVEGGEHGTALQAASYQGHTHIVKILLQHGADPDAEAGHYGNALYTASERGHKEVVKLLLGSGADRNAQSGHFGSALQAAMERGHHDVVKLLDDEGDELHSKVDGSQNAREKGVRVDHR